MYEPPVQFDPNLDHRPAWIYVITLIILWSLPWFGIECVFGWCIVQDIYWWVYAAALALPVLLLLEFPLRLLDKIRGVEEKDD